MNNFWQNLFDAWEKSYYGEPIWFCSMCATLYAGIKHYRSEKSYWIFLGYTIAGIIIFLGATFCVTGLGLKNPTATIILESSNVAFCAIEIFLFYSFFFDSTDNTKVKVIIMAMLVFFLLLCFRFFFILSSCKFSRKNIVNLSFQLNVIEFLLLLAPCFYQFYMLFTLEPSVKNPIKSPSLWINSGILFYVSTSLPFLLAGDLLGSKDKSIGDALYSIHYLSLSILFLCISKAFTCKVSLTT